MKTIFRVAGTELRMLFYSPIAWFVLIVFLVQSGIVYLGMIDGVATQQEMGGIRIRYIFDLTARLFVGKSGLFPHIMENLYLYIPLLTMGLISRETSSGTIKLLYSSPIKVREIIFGKYLAMMVYSFLLLLIVALFVCSGIYHIQEADKGMLMTSLVGFYLLLCVYSAIGLFMSCLTTYQIVAAVCTFVMIGLLSYIGSVWQGIEFVRDITYYLSIAGRTEKMLRGLISSKDVIYFIVIISIFLGLSIYKLKSGMESKSAAFKAGRYAAVVALSISVGYIFSLPWLIGYHDASLHQRNTVLPHVQKIIEDLGDEPLEVITYNNVLAASMGMGMDASYNRVASTWEMYNRFKKGHNIKVHKAINFYDSTLDNTTMLMGYPDKSLKEIAQQLTKATGMSMKDVKTPEEIRKIIDLRPEMNRFVMQLKYKDKTTFLRIFDDQTVWPGETEVSAAFKRLMQAKLPKVAFVTGNMERSIFRRGDREYAKIATARGFRYALINQGFDVDTVSLDNRDVPADISSLVIADPKLEWSETALVRLRQYISSGGNLLIACEPGKSNVTQPILDEVGVEMMPGRLVQADKDAAPDKVRLNLTKEAAGLSKYLAEIKEDTMAERVAMGGVAGLVYTGKANFTAKPLLVTDNKITWNRIKALDPEMMTSAMDGSMMMGSIYGGKDDEQELPAEKTDTAKNRRENTADPKKKAPATQVNMVNTKPYPSLVKHAVVRETSDQPASSRARGRGGRPGDMGTIVFSPEEGDTKGVYPTALSLSRNINGKEQRIVVTGDADFMKNGSMSMAGFHFTNSLFSWLSYDEFPISSYRPKTNDTAVKVSTEQVGTLRLLYLWVLPGLLIAFAAILLIRRKRK
ncbi:Gldg family protein [Parasegetibacter sp. NRK P23]|uniref:Gldg family protein n=1 Tax=Parasegetibacter sp. NRK P23 TaxID=2942999 RepID=UPI002043A9BB|nr:Gldg family protein [Parasegetibacter sp. NRK P23]MCM5527593.1 Gldg family protein [Parasegetibacter sp. NRK P23]